jgi:glycerophosphoryl diester phosphodiesterase
LIQLIDKEFSSAQIQERLAEIHAYAVGIGPARTSVDAALIDASHAHGLVVHPYTIDEETELKRFVALGVDGMFTNYPDRLARLLDR